MARSGPISLIMSDNRQAHIDTTGPEIYEQTEGKLDGFVSAVGTGGTLGGVSLYMKDPVPRISRSRWRILLALRSITTLSMVS